MCWNMAASASLAVAGTAGSIYFWKKGEDKALCVPLFYFAIMEMIQTYTWTVIDQCFDPGNQAATTAAYLHIAFQPFFFNAIAMHFIPHHRRQKIWKGVYFLCLIASLAIVARILPLEWKHYCFEIRYRVPFTDNLIYRIPFCGGVACTTTGAWHMEWAIKAGFNWYLDRAYFVSVFLLPLAYGSWKATLYAAIGPLITLITTDTSNEFASVWCFYSVALVLLMIKLPIRKYLYVDSFYGTGWFGFRKQQSESD